MSMNHIAIHGRLTRDPETSQTTSGVTVCRFNVAVDRRFARQGEDKQTDFFDVVAWRGLGEMVGKYFTKGKEIVVTGEMQSRRWQDKNGTNRISWEIQADNVDFCGGKSDAPAKNANENLQQGQDSSEGEPDDEEDLPF